MFRLSQLCVSGLCALAVLAGASAVQAMPLEDFSLSGAYKVVKGVGDGLGGTLTPATLTFGQFRIDAQNGGVGALDGALLLSNGLLGTIGGPYFFDNPNGANTVTLINPSPNNFIIGDGLGNDFVAPIELFQLVEQSVGGSLQGRIDFLSATYGGTNVDLLALVGLVANGKNIGITLQTGGGPLDLDQLFANSRNFSYSATASIVPEPATLALLGIGLLGAGMAVRRRRQAAS